MPDSVQTCYPLSMDSMGNCLYVGDSAGNLNLVDITAESALQFVQSYKTGHTGRITGVQSSLGSVVTCATDGAIKIYHPSSNLEPLSSIQVLLMKIGILFITTCMSYDVYTGTDTLMCRP